MPDSVSIEAVRAIVSRIKLISSAHTVTSGEVAFSDADKASASMPMTATVYYTGNFGY